MNRGTVRWAPAAVGGIVLAAAISWTTSQLTSQHIGLSSEPLTAGRRLAPAAAARLGAGEQGPTRTQTGKRSGSAGAPTAPSSTPTTTGAVAPAEPTPAAESPPAAGTGSSQGPSSSSGSRDDGSGSAGGGGGGARAAGGRDD